MKVVKDEHNVVFSGEVAIAGSGAFFNSLCKDLSDFSWVRVDALGFTVDEYTQSERFSLFCRHDASAGP